MKVYFTRCEIFNIQTLRCTLSYIVLMMIGSYFWVFIVTKPSTIMDNFFGVISKIERLRWCTLMHSDKFSGCETLYSPTALIYTSLIQVGKCVAVRKSKSAINLIRNWIPGSTFSGNNGPFFFIFKLALHTLNETDDEKN